MSGRGAARPVPAPERPLAPSGDGDGEALRRALLDWFAVARRDLPWRRPPRDAYRVWVSEAMLQQTRASVAVPYFERFVERFPTPAHLAAAPEEEVLRTWQGLGYYGRARALQAAVREVAERYGGRVPADPAAFGALPGVGPYTVGAVLSIAYGLRLPAVDGNVLRVMARWFDIREPVEAPAVRRSIESRASALVPADDPGTWNEALMELGAQVCLPRAPRCDRCPVAGLCRAGAAGPAAAAALPAHRSSPAPRAVRVVAAVAEDPAGRWCVVRRPAHGLLARMWEFPGGEVGAGGEDPAAALAELLWRRAGLRVGAAAPLPALRHVFSHRVWDLRAFRCQVLDPLPPERDGLRWLPPDELDAVPMAAAHLRVAAIALRSRTSHEGM